MDAGELQLELQLGVIHCVSRRRAVLCARLSQDGLGSCRLVLGRKLLDNSTVVTESRHIWLLCLPTRAGFGVLPKLLVACR